MQKGLAPAARNCTLRVSNPTHPRSCCLPLQSANTSPPEFAPRRAGPSGHTWAGRHGFGVLTRSVAPVQEDRTASAIQNQNTGSGISTRLGAIARVCPNLRFRCYSVGAPSARASVSVIVFSHGSHLIGCDWLTVSASCKTAGVA